MGFGVRGGVAALVLSAVGIYGCSNGPKRAPRIAVDLTDDDSKMGDGGSDGDGTGGSSDNPSETGGTGGTGGGSGGAEAEKVPHSVYLYGIKASDESRQLCEIGTDEVVGASNVNYSELTGLVHPTTGDVWTAFGGTGIVKDVSEHEDVCAGTLQDFSFHPETGALASKCGDVWYDETGTPTPKPAKFRDEAGRFFDGGELFDATGTAIPLETSLANKTFHAVHARPGGGFFALSVDGDADAVVRYAIDPEGSVETETLTGREKFADVNIFHVGAALDELGGIWLQGYPPSGIQFSVVVRVRSDLSSASIVYSQGACDLADYWGLIFSTP